jgi:hypothetical protein
MISPAAVTQGSLRTSAGRALPLTSTEVHARVQGPAANVLVRQRFHNDTPDPIEAVYAFPLPDGASVHRMLFRIADRVVRAAVEEKAAARRTYEQAKSEGRAATLLEEDQPTLFTLSVANVAPGATIDVELEYQELVTFDDGKFRLVFPMVAPERYRDGPAPSSREKLRPPRAPTGERSPDVAIEVEIQSATSSGPVHDVRCLSHPVVVLPLPGRGIRARLAPSAALANRDFVVEWQVAEEGVRPRVYVERAAGEAGTFLLSVLPSAPDRSADEPRTSMKALCCGNCGGVVTDVSAIREIPGLGAVLPCRYCGAVLTPGTERITRAARPRDVVILVDRSASMRGAIDQAKAAVRSILEGLSADDAAQILAFDHDPLFFDRRGGAGWLSSSPELIVGRRALRGRSRAARRDRSPEHPRAGRGHPLARRAHAGRRADHRRGRGQRGAAPPARARDPGRGGEALRARRRAKCGPAAGLEARAGGRWRERRAARVGRSRRDARALFAARPGGGAGAHGSGAVVGGRGHP